MTGCSQKTTRATLAVLATLTVALAFAGPAMAQNVNVNPGGGSYATLKAAFDAINAGTHTGAVTVDIVGNTTETVPAVLNASGSGAASYTSIVISPNGGAARTISGAIAAGSSLIDLNGADNVTIDGLNTGGNSLTISNTTVSATSGTSTIQFRTDATNNLITRCSVLGSATMAVGTNGGNIWFGAGAVTTGNDNNTVSLCNIGPAGSNLPTKGVYFSGTTTTTALNNSGITINNCNIFDYFGAAVTSAGVYVSTGSTDINITNNLFYQTASRTQTTGGQHSAIWITNTSGNNYQVTGNTIGYASNAQTGTYTFVGTTSSTLIPIFLNVGTTTATSVQGNTIAGIAMSGSASGTSTSAPFRGIYVSSGLTTIGDVTGNTIGSQSATGSITYTSSSTSASDVIGMYNFGSSNWTTNNNTIGGITASNSSTGAANIYGLRCNTGSSVTWSVQNNTIGGSVANSINSTSTATGTVVQGILNSNPIGTFTGNTIRNMTVAGGTGTTSSASMIGIVITTSSANQTVSQNSIFNLSNTNTTASSVVTGIQFSGSTTNVVARNLIYGLTSATNSASAEINGIRVAGGTTTYRNNMIALGAGVANAIGAAASNSGVSGINGINEALGTDNFYHNSVYIGGTATAGSGASYAFNGTQTTNSRSFRDNIFFNARGNSGATGKHYAIKINGTSAPVAGLTLNNNVYFANGTGGVFGFFNSLDVASLSAWKAAVGQDAASFEGNPQYLDPTNATPDLHISPSLATVIEGNGFDLGVTDDYDGQARSGLTPVDIGADAGNFVAVASMSYVSSTTTQNNTSTVGTNTTNQEVIGIQIVTTGASNPLLATSFTLNTNGTTSTGDIANAKLFYTGTSSAFATGTQFGSAVAAPSGSFSITGSQALSEGTNYFWLTYDVPCGAIAGNVVDAECNSLTVGSVQTPTVQAPAGSRGIVNGPLNGTYTVGTGGNYATLTAAVADVNAKGLGGNTTLSILNSLAEAGAVTINQWAECGGSGFTLTIRPAATTTPTISGSVASGALIKLNGADRVTIDGSNSGGTDRSLTITNTSTTAPTVISIASLGAGAGGTNNVIKNCNLSTGVATSIGYGISVGGSTPGSPGADNDNVTLQNNAITLAPIGIYANGTTLVSAGGDDNLAIVGNSIDYNNTTSGLASIGIQVGNALTSSVSQNTVSEQTSSSQSPTAISLETGFVSSSVTRNLITKSVTTNTGGYGGRGITVGTGTATSALQISNNVIYGVNGTNWSGFSNSSSMGIAIGMIGNSSTVSTTTGGIGLYFNSVYMSGTYSSTTACLTAALYVGSGASALDLQDNVLVNALNNTGTGSPSKAYAIYSAAANTAFTTINYNDFFVSGAQGVLGFLTSDRTNLAGIQAGFGQNANSITNDPLYNSTTNLQPQAGSPVVDTGVTLSGIVSPYVDFTGATRVDAPSMGAYEAASDAAPPVISYTPLATACTTSARTLTATITDASGVPTSGPGLPVLYWKINAGAYTAATATYGGGSSYSFSFGAGVVANDVVSYYIVAQDTAATPNVTSLPTGASGFTINPPAASTPPASPSTYGVVPIAPTASASSATTCAGQPVNLFSTPSTSGLPPTILTQDFESGLGSWTTINNTTTTGTGNPADTAWTIRPNPYTSANTTPVTFNSSGGSNFILSNADLGASGTSVYTILQSPAFSTVGYTSLNVAWREYFRLLTAPEAFIEASTDGTNWTILKSLAATQGTSTGFVADSTAANAFAGQPTVYVRFRYQGGWAWYWGIDDIVVSGTSVTYTYNWSSSPSGFSSTDQNPTGVSPSVTTTYTVTVTNSSGCSDTASTTVTVNAAPTAPSALAATPSSFSCGAGTTALTATFDPGDTIEWFTNSACSGSPIADPANVPVAATTSYYAHTRNATCASACIGPVTVTVTNDTTVPTIVSCAPPQSANASGTCQVALPDFTTGVTANDDCTPSGSLVITQTPAAGTLVGTGVTNVTIKVTDAANNFSTCPTTFTVTDVTPPSITTCGPAQSAFADVNCQAAVPDFTATTVASDNCSFTLSQVPAAGTLVGLGITNVTITATDGAMLTATCGTTFTVTDGTAPSHGGTCPANITVNADPGSTSASGVTWTPPTWTDNCTATVTDITASHTPPATFPIGVTSVTYTAKDDAMNTATCSFTVTVVDAEAPNFNGTCPMSITVNADPGACGTVVSWTPPTATDNNGTPTVTQTQGLAPGSTFNVGTTHIQYTATDAANNTTLCDFDVIVVDNQDPIIAGCPGNISVNTDAGVCTAVVSWTAPTFTDNCPGGSIVQTAGLASGSAFPLGATTVTYTATDASSRTATCSFTVTVTDAELPSITDCGPAQSANADANCQAVVPDFTAAVVATDNCTLVANLVITQVPAAGSLVSVGVNNVAVSVKDQANNTATCNNTFTVNDVTPPTILGCPANIVTNVNALGCNAVVSWTAPTAGDNCAGASIAQTAGPASGSTFANGSVTTITYTATDAANNTASCSFTVSVVAAPDVNNDGIVDVNDVLAFVNVLTGVDTDPVHVARCDVNCDGAVNGLDVQPFADYLTP